MRKIFVFAFALAASTLMACSGSKSVTEPTPGPPPPSVVLPPVFALPGIGEVPVGAVFNEGDEIVITVQKIGNGGTLIVAFVFSRDGDGGTAVVLCSMSAGNSSGMVRQELKFQDRFYAWAKGHVLNGILLQTDLEDPNEFWRMHSCYFLGAGQIPLSFDPVQFEKADKRTDYDLNWRVN